MFRSLIRRAAELGILAGSVVGIANAQLPPQSKFLRAAEPGTIGIDRSQPGWVDWALDELALRANQLLVHRSVFQTDHVPGHYSSEGVLKVADGVEGIRQFAATAGYETIMLGPNVLLLREKDDDTEAPLILFAEQLPLGEIRWDRSISRDKLEWALFMTAGPGLRMLDSYQRADPNYFGTHYWASKEGGGHEFYVVQEMESGRAKIYATQRSLRKVVAEERSGGIEIRDLWMDATGKSPVGQFLNAPVADVELDFDGDGVVDVLVYDGDRNRQSANPPLRILSGKTGKEIARLEGYEFLVTERPGGGKVVTSVDGSGYRVYETTAETPLKLTSRKESDPNDDRALERLENLTTARKRLASAQALASERVLEHFVMPGRPAALNPALFTGIRQLKELGKMTIEQREIDAGRDARIYLNYWPEPKTQPNR